MLESIFKTSETSTLTIESFLICVAAAIILGLLIAFTHMKTTKYNKNFITTLTILPMLVAIIIIMTNGNLGTSIAVLGAFSLIRFRSIPGTSKEITSIFFTMTIGLALGMGHIVFASISTIIICLLLFILNKFNFGEEPSKILIVTIPENLDYTNIFDDIFSKTMKSYTLEKVKTTNMGSLFELTYNVKIKKEVNEKELIDDIRCRNGNLKVYLCHACIEGEL